MKNTNLTLSLIAKVIGLTAFAVVFMLNIMLFVKNDHAFGNLSLASLKAFADDEAEETSAAVWFSTPVSTTGTDLAYCPARTTYKVTWEKVDNSFTLGSYYQGFKVELSVNGYDKGI